jgi:hypothetical protein
MQCPEWVGWFHLAKRGRWKEKVSGSDRLAFCPPCRSGHEGLFVDLRPYTDRSVYSVSDETSLFRVSPTDQGLFRSCTLR